METFVPPVVFRYAETGDGGGSIHHLADLFFEGHAADEVVDALACGQVGVLKRKLRAEMASRKEDSDQDWEEKLFQSIAVWSLI
jgi:hypothetical protein